MGLCLTEESRLSESWCRNYRQETGWITWALIKARKMSPRDTLQLVSIQGTYESRACCNFGSMTSPRVRRKSMPAQQLQEKKIINTRNVSCQASLEPGLQFLSSVWSFFSGSQVLAAALVLGMEEHKLVFALEKERRVALNLSPHSVLWWFGFSTLVFGRMSAVMLSTVFLAIQEYLTGR